MRIPFDTAGTPQADRPQHEEFRDFAAGLASPWVRRRIHHGISHGHAGNSQGLEPT